MEIAVISGKGGTGKSSITAALATLAKSAVLADCDVDAANMHLIMNPDIRESFVYIAGEKAVIDYAKCRSCGLCQEYCRFDAIRFGEGKYEIDEVSCDGCKLCSRICPAGAITMHKNDKSRMHTGIYRYGHMVFGRLEPGEENSGKLVAMVRSKAREMSEKSGINTILIDSPPGIGCAVISSVTGVDRIFIVTEPSLSAFSDLKRTIELIDLLGTRMSVIINKYDLAPQVSDIIEEYCREKGVEISGKLPFDEEFVHSMVQCKSIIETKPDSEAGIVLSEIWKKLLNEKIRKQISTIN